MSLEEEPSSFSCVLCRQSDFFEGDVFGPRTVMMCDTCDREYHVKCLSESGGEDLEVREIFMIISLS